MTQAAGIATASSSSRRRRRTAIAKLRATRAQLAQLKPAFCSVTFGAGGSTREGTLDDGASRCSAKGWRRRRTCRASAAAGESLRDVLAQYRAHGIRHLVALRGDLPSGTVDAGEFRYASDLVAFIREETGGLVPRRRGRAIPSITRRRAPRRRTSTTSSARCAPAPTPRSRSTSSTATRTGASSTRARRAASRFPSCPASCRSSRRAGSRASPMRAARRFRAGSGASSKATATTRRRCARSASTS